ncbi:MAG: hypothetical protein KatS3mg040_0508 [Candidatus Kapaibacterium sp.]|nr:MAG: hypothetical protein KatS3mg040_0508 [Candidatus Kapabacteria bacterium]
MPCCVCVVLPLGGEQESVEKPIALPTEHDQRTITIGVTMLPLRSVISRAK